jgi:predicted GNAT family N-acyltransferase
MEDFNFEIVESESELAKAFEVRRQVFVEEQGIAEELVYDGADSAATHLIVSRGEKAIGTARVRFLKPGEAKLERMAVLPAYRQRDIGRRIVSYLNAALRQKQVEKVVLHAQYNVVGFYRKCGFEAVGEPFDEAGIRHVKMQRRL